MTFGDILEWKYNDLMTNEFGESGSDTCFLYTAARATIAWWSKILNSFL